MSTLAEIAKAVESLPREDQEKLMRHLSSKLRGKGFSTWPVPPPDVPREEIRRIQAEIDATFGMVGDKP